MLPEDPCVMLGLVDSKPLFATPAEYEAWREQFIADVAPAHKENDRRRAQSMAESMNRIVD